MQQHRLTAIMFTDIVGYTALMGQSESSTLKVLDKNRNIHRQELDKFNGEWIKEIGDGILSSFNTPSDAVYCAISILEKIKQIPELNLRIGIHLGEVSFTGDDILGEGVNIASRIQAYAGSNKIYISESVWESIHNKEGIFIRYVGEKKLKNVDKPIRIYEVSKERIKIAGWRNMWEKYSGLRYFIILALFTSILAILFYNTDIFYISKNDLEKNSIIVLPLNNLTGIDSLDYLCYAFADHINTPLSKNSHIKRIVSTSTGKAIRDEVTELDQIAKKLGVHFLLDGNLNNLNDKLNINIKLIDDNNNYVWSEEYDLSDGDIVSIQTEIINQIAKRMTSVEKFDKNNFSNSNYNTSKEVVSLYEKGKFYCLEGFSDREYNIALNYFNKALEIDSSFAEAYAGKARAYAMLGTWFGSMNRDSSALLAYANAFKAQELKPNLGDVYFAIGIVKLHIEWDINGAEQYFRKANSVDPSGNYELGFILYLRGKISESCEFYKEKLTENLLDPTIWIDYPIALYLAGRKEEAYNMYFDALNNKFLKDESFYQIFNNLLSDFYLWDGHYEEAIKYVLKAVEANPDWNFEKYRKLGCFEAHKGNLSVANQYIDSLITLGNSSTPKEVYWVEIAQIYSCGSNKEKTIESLQKAYAEREQILIWIKVLPLFDSLRSSPEFQTIVNKLTL